MITWLFSPSVFILSPLSDVHNVLRCPLPLFYEENNHLGLGDTLMTSFLT